MYVISVFKIQNITDVYIVHVKTFIFHMMLIMETFSILGKAHWDVILPHLLENQQLQTTAISKLHVSFWTIRSKPTVVMYYINI